MARIHVLGAGISGLWQAIMLQSRGHAVSLHDPAGIPSGAAASRFAGAMLAPYCEGEAGHELVRELGLRSVEIWKAVYPATIMSGTLVVAAARDQAELRRFSNVTAGHRAIGKTELTELEPGLGERFAQALYYPDEGHVETMAALTFLAEAVKDKCVDFRDGEKSADFIVDCTGIAAREQLKTLRGVRGERLLIECPSVSLKRPVRLLHPRIPFYIVPWAGSRFMAGATVIESEDAGEITVRSALELLSAAYSLEPLFGEARLLEAVAGVRPAFPDNLPKVIVRGRHIFVNGLYRHGFLLSPILAQLTADYIESGTMREGIVFEDQGEW